MKKIIPQLYNTGKAESSSRSNHLACLRVRWTKETLLRDLDTFVWHSYLRVELFIYWPLIIGHNIHNIHVRVAYDKFPDFFRMGTFIDSTHMKL